ncbi:hypothetical protein CLF_101211 [Clonorchis sinensis]|uniref:Reverse transcriptase domain-containing protein n=1 Tax=Clonorchis sinensis TaxID=79923 RepID=G7Y585_CLOSI|nr:hypothetical protein CLF_101211 [Clonorchis sinensis]
MGKIQELVNDPQTTELDSGLEPKYRQLPDGFLYVATYKPYFRTCESIQRAPQNLPYTKRCPLSSFLLNFVIDEIMSRTLEGQIAFDEKFVRLKCADDVVLVFEERGGALEVVERFVYFGSCINTDCRVTRICKARVAFSNLGYYGVKTSRRRGTGKRVENGFGPVELTRVRVRLSEGRVVTIWIPLNLTHLPSSQLNCRNTHKPKKTKENLPVAPAVNHQLKHPEVEAVNGHPHRHFFRSTVTGDFGLKSTTDQEGHDYAKPIPVRHIVVHVEVPESVVWPSRISNKKMSKVGPNRLCRMLKNKLGPNIGCTGTKWETGLSEEDSSATVDSKWLRSLILNELPTIEESINSLPVPTREPLTEMCAVEYNPLQLNNSGNTPRDVLIVVSSRAHGLPGDKSEDVAGAVILRYEITVDHDLFESLIVRKRIKIGREGSSASVHFQTLIQAIWIEIVNMKATDID